MGFFDNQLKDLLANNEIVQDFKKQFLVMQQAIIDLEHKLEEIEKILKPVNN